MVPLRLTYLLLDIRAKYFCTEHPEIKQS